MISIKVNSDNDIFIDNTGNLAMCSDLEACMQGCEQAARIVLGELPFAQLKGVPFFDIVFTSSPDLSLYEVYLRRLYMGVPNVTGINYINFKLEGTELSYEAGIVTIYGEGVISGNL